MRYHYHGPATALTLSEHGQLVDRLLATGQIVDLPPEHPIIVRWLADKRLTPVDEGKANPSPIVPAVAPPSAGTVSDTVSLIPPVTATNDAPVVTTAPAPAPASSPVKPSKDKPAPGRERRDGR